MDKLHKVLNNTSNGNIINVQFIPFNKKEKQVKWTLELGKFYLV